MKTEFENQCQSNLTSLEPLAWTTNVVIELSGIKREVPFNLFARERETSESSCVLYAARGRQGNLLV